MQLVVLHYHCDIQMYKLYIELYNKGPRLNREKIKVQGLTERTFLSINGTHYCFDTQDEWVQSFTEAAVKPQGL